MHHASTTPPQALPRRTEIKLTLVVLLLVGGVVSFVVWAAPRQEVRQEVDPTLRLLDLPGIFHPPTRYADMAELSEDTVVIGLEAGNRHRAYVLAAFLGMDHHIVNDVLGDVPITVTYCDRSDCTRVFINPNGEHPLDIALGGWIGRYTTGSLLLRVGLTLYRQDTGQPLGEDATTPFPYAIAAFVRTTWKQWREAHPDTDVYVGVLPP